MDRLQLIVACTSLFVIAGPVQSTETIDPRDTQPGPYIDAGVVLHLKSDPAIDTWRMGGEGQCLYYIITADQTSAETSRRRAAREHRLGLLTVEHRRNLAALPLATNLANLVVIDDWPTVRKRGLGVGELLRVTAPFGRVYVGGIREAELRRAIETEQLESQVESITRQSGFLRITTAVPATMAEWTHPVGNPGNRRVADDLLNCKILNPMLWGLYKKGIEDSDRMRSSLWPRWVAGEHRGAKGISYRGLLIAGGRVFGMSNMESLAWHTNEALRGKRMLVARDAFSGLVQWYSNEVSELYAANHRAVLAKGPSGLTALDATTGEQLWTQRIFNVKDLLLLDDLVVWKDGQTIQTRRLETGDKAWSVNTGLPVQGIMADGEVILADIGQSPRRAGPSDPRALLALNRADGKQLWKLDDKGFWENARSMKLSCVGQGRALLLKGAEARVLSLATGKLVFKHVRAAEKTAHGYLGKGGGRDLIQMAGNHLLIDTSRGFILVDLASGKEQEIPATTLHGLGAWACNGNGTFTLGTIRSSVDGKPASPVEHDLIGHLPVKNSCGSVPPVAYHTAYSRQHKCFCGMFYGRLRGFVASGPVDPIPSKSSFSEPGPLEKGPAFEEPVAVGQPADWPCFRADNRRSCATSKSIAPEPATQWKQTLTTTWPNTRIASAEWRARHLYSGRISAPVADASSVYISLPDDHQFVCLDASTGKERWRFTAGAAIDSPPTLYQGRCFFGCRDGWLYAVDPGTGGLIWRRRITPVDQRVQIYGQLENRFPLRGSVMVHDGRLYATAGLHGLMGVMLCVLDPASGKVIEYRQLLRGGYNNDVLVADPTGKLYLGPLPLDPTEAKERETAWARHKDTPALRVNAGRLDRSAVNYLLNLDSEILNTAKTLSAIHEPQVAASNVRRPTFVLYLNGQQALNWTWNDELQIGVRSRTLLGWKTAEQATKDGKQPVEDRTGPLFATSRQDLANRLKAINSAGRSKRKQPPQAPPRWQKQLGSIWALALAGDHLILGGPVLEHEHHDPHKAKGQLWVLDVKTGNLLSEIQLPRSPIQDGIAIAGGRVFLSLCDGSAMCLK